MEIKNNIFVIHSGHLIDEFDMYQLWIVITRPCPNTNGGLIRAWEMITSIYSNGCN